MRVTLLQLCASLLERKECSLTAPRAAVACAWDPEPGTMALDVIDADEITQRSCIRILTPRFGDIHARVTGKEDDPLLLLVHGKGPQTARCSGTSSHQRCAQLLIQSFG
jgi:hypothetical protein